MQSWKTVPHLQSPEEPVPDPEKSLILDSKWSIHSICNVQSGNYNHLSSRYILIYREWILEHWHSRLGGKVDLRLLGRREGKLIQRL